MKTLNELTPKERLDLYKKALKDWAERPNDKKYYTDSGLCRYLYFIHAVDTCDHTMNGRLFNWKNRATKCNEWQKHVVGAFIPGSGYIGRDRDPIPRISALKAMIKDLEEQL